MSILIGYGRYQPPVGNYLLFLDVAILVEDVNRYYYWQSYKLS